MIGRGGVLLSQPQTQCRRQEVHCPLTRHSLLVSRTLQRHDSLFRACTHPACGAALEAACCAPQQCTANSTPCVLAEAQQPGCTTEQPEEPARAWPPLPARYKLTSTVIGQGHFGKVVLGTELIPGGESRKLAIKIIQKRRSDMPVAQHMSAIENEVHIMSACGNSCSVVQLEGVYEDEEAVYMVQELCLGGDLRSVLQNGPLSEQEAAHVMQVVLDVIHECHVHHYSYGDVKPANFLLRYPHHSTGCTCYPASSPAAHSVPCEGCPSGSSTTTAAAPTSDGAASAGTVQGAQVAVPAQASFDAACSGSMSDGGISGSGSSSDGNGMSRMCTAVVAANECALDMRLPLADGSLTHTPISSRARMAAAAAAVAHAAGSKQGGSAAAAPDTPAPVANNIVPLTQPASGAVHHIAHVDHDGCTAHVQHDGCTAAHVSCSHTESGVCARALSPQGGTPRQAAAGTSPPLTVVATDFGCAQPLHSRARCSWTATKRMGSPVYMAPELWQGSGAVGLAIDMWAAGVMLYQLLSGRYPFWAMDPQDIDADMALYQVVCGTQSNPVILSGEPWSHVSKSCKDLIMAMLERSPEQRITALQALQHPWMVAQLGHVPQPTSCVNPYDSLCSVDKEAEPQALAHHQDRGHMAACSSLSSHQDLEFDLEFGAV